MILTWLSPHAEVYISLFDSVCAPPKPSFTQRLAGQPSVRNHWLGNEGRSEARTLFWILGAVSICSVGPD
ncbi:MAG TPA: hypothetical protein VIH75_05900 [Candidatus Sulfotelmatobacter sp.]